MIAWPDDTRESQKAHALRHVESIEFAIAWCWKHRTAVQAGGNMGLWPIRLAGSFKRVITFEPEGVSLACLLANTLPFKNIEVLPVALGAEQGYCDMERRSLGSHRVVEGDTIPMIALDSLGLDDVDLLQFDIEGYELQALRGSMETINRSHPVIQVELRGFTEEYGGSDTALQVLLESNGYKEVGQQPGNDFIFAYGN